MSSSRLCRVFLNLYLGRARSLSGILYIPYFCTNSWKGALHMVSSRVLNIEIASRRKSCITKMYFWRIGKWVGNVWRCYIFGYILHNKSDCLKIKNIRQFEQRYSVEPKGFEMNQSKGTFCRKHYNFLQICRSSLALDGYTIGQVRLYKRTIYV